MRTALLGCCLLAALLSPAASASVPAWTDSLQAEYDKLLTEVQQEQWERQEGAQPGVAELRLADLSAALLIRLKDQPTSWKTAQRRLQLQQNAAKRNMGKVALDGMLSVEGELRQEKVYEAFREYLNVQKAMAASHGMKSASQLWWSPFVTSSGDARSSLQTMWSQVGPLVSSLTSYLRGLPAPASGKLQDLLYACAARDDCSDLVKFALPYPDVSNVVSDLLHEKDLTTEQLARLAEKLLILLGLPAAPAEFWTNSQFDTSAACTNYVDSEKVRLCANADAEGLKSALTLMTEAEYLRTAAVSQKAPFQTPAFPGFERAVSECVSLLSLEPSVVQQLVYGYSAQADGEPHLAPVSLYLARGGRPSGRPDARCAGDIGCQQTANALMEAAVTQLLPLGYHMASLRWLEAVESAPKTDAAAAWLAELQRVLGEPAVTAVPAKLDPHFYDAGRHISRLLAGVAGFQLRAAACPAAGDCLPAGADAAGALIRKVMASGSSLPWDQLLSETTQLTPSAAPLVAYFQPLQKLTAESPETPKTLHRIELEDDAVDQLLSKSAAVVETIHAPSADMSHCENVADEDKTSQEKALCDWNDMYDGLKRNMTEAEWAFGLIINDEQTAEDVVMTRQEFLKERNTARSALTGDVNKWINDSTNPDEAALWGEMFILSEKDAGMADDATVKKLLDSTAALLKAYTGVSVCPYDQSGCEDDAKMTIWDLQMAMAAGGMAEKEIQYYWREYRNAAKTDLNGAFGDYINSGRDAAKQAGLDHYGQFWLEPYGYPSKDETLLTELAATWSDLDELYRSLHTVVRHQLKEAGLSTAQDKQPLPSHLLGDMFAADWRNIYNATKLYNNYTIDIADELEKKSYDIVKIRDDAVEYLKNLGLYDLSTTSCFAESNWTECIKGRDCDALAWISGDDDCVRIRAGTEVTMDNYELVHIKSAEQAYYLEYMDLDPEYRAPANPAFTGAVAGAVSLSVLSPHHLDSKGLLPMDMTEVDGMYDIDFLYRRALQYLSPMPFDYVTDKWLWELFKNTLEDRWEHRWWELREEIQGVRPSEKRTAGDRDMLAVPDLARDRPAFQRYMATVLQFQLFEKLCIDAGQYDIMKPEGDKALHRCDLSASTNSPKLKELMAAGNTQRWQTLVANHTVNGTLSSESMVRYFAPLHAHLKEVISTNNLQTTWESNLADYWDEEVDNTVPIVVGVVLGVLVLIVVIAYFVSRVRRNKGE